MQCLYFIMMISNYFIYTYLLLLMESSQYMRKKHNTFDTKDTKFYFIGHINVCDRVHLADDWNCGTVLRRLS